MIVSVTVLIFICIVQNDVKYLKEKVAEHDKQIEELLKNMGKVIS
jgi:hypothetical protein